MIAIVDYGVGNLFSLLSSLRALDLEAEVTGDAGRLRAADRIILPGVGAFGDARAKLDATGLVPVIQEEAEKKPLLGICLGMQLLFQWGEEGRRCEGLGLISGGVRRIETDLKLPHIGWNSLTFPRPSPLFRGLDEGCCVYFVHSFCGHTEDPDQAAAVTDYGGPVLAAVQDAARGVFGCQFHPEKSGETGLAILQNFAALNR